MAVPQWVVLGHYCPSQSSLWGLSHFVEGQRIWSLWQIERIIPSNPTCGCSLECFTLLSLSLWCFYLNIFTLLVKDVFYFLIPMSTWIGSWPFIRKLKLDLVPTFFRLLPVTMQNHYLFIILLFMHYINKTSIII